MFEVRKMKLEHLLTLAKEPDNAFIGEWLKNGIAESWVEAEECFSGFVNDQLMICAGISRYWNGRGHIWSVFSENARRYFVAVFRGMRRFLQTTNYARLEMDIPLDRPYSALAHRRALLLGFELECSRARKFRPSGSDSALYAWVREN